MSNNAPDAWVAAIANEDPEAGKLARLLYETERESDRGVVLVMSGFLEEQLKELLVGYFVHTPSTAILLDSGLAPLSTFAARIHATHALGLITDEECHDLTVIRKIRNRFAHTLDVSFEDQSIVARCLTFKHEVQPFHDEEEGPIEPKSRTRFTACAISLILVFRNRAHEIGEHRLSLIEWKQEHSKPDRFAHAHPPKTESRKPKR